MVYLQTVLFFMNKTPLFVIFLYAVSLFVFLKKIHGLFSIFKANCNFRRFLLKLGDLLFSETRVLRNHIKRNAGFFKVLGNSNFFLFSTLTMSCKASSSSFRFVMEIVTFFRFHIGERRHSL